MQTSVLQDQRTPPSAVHALLAHTRMQQVTRIPCKIASSIYPHHEIWYGALLIRSGDVPIGPNDALISLISPNDDQEYIHNWSFLIQLVPSFYEQVTRNTSTTRGRTAAPNKIMIQLKFSLTSLCTDRGIFLISWD
jgi:hypothetical protein